LKSARPVVSVCCGPTIWAEHESQDHSTAGNGHAPGMTAPR
jgi:hypothetical protein